MSDEAGDPGERLVNGVFQGGGAKSVAYAGALRAIEDRGLWFGSVSGASAGAIVASLIASGLSLDEMESKVSEVLAAARSPIPARVGKLVIGHAHSVFEGRRLRAVLDDAYRSALGIDGDEAVTFRQLFDATGIELYVLTLDLSNGLPVVFCRRTTPDADVAGAVTASSAIPGAFPAGRAVFDSSESGAVVHQLVDGGAYANYPSFIFDDRSFRCWLRDETKHLDNWDAQDDERWEAEALRPVVGFVLGDPEPLEHRNAAGFVPSAGPEISRRFDLGPTYTSGKRNSFLFGAVLASDWARLLIGIALVVWIGTSIATLPLGFRRFATWLGGWIPDFLFPLVLVGALAILVLSAITALLVIAGLITVSRMLAETALPSAKAVLGVPLEVPPWLGTGDDSVVVRVPTGELSTVDFDVDETTRADAVALAHESVAAQLDEPRVSACLAALLAGRPHERAHVKRGRRTLDPPTSDDRLSASGVLTLVAATCLMGIVAWWATNAAGAQSIGAILAAIAVAVLAGVAVLVTLGDSASRRAATRAGNGITATSRRPVSVPVLWMLLGGTLVVAGLGLSAWTMSIRSDHTADAVVVSATEAAGDTNSYVVRLDDDDDGTATLTTDRHLRLGERVFVTDDTPGDEVELVGALDDARFAVAIVFCALGFGLIAAGVRSNLYRTRSRRLDELVTHMRAKAGT